MARPEPGNEHTLTGIGLILLAFVFFTGIDSSAKWLAQAGLPILQVVFLRYAMHLVLAGTVLLPRAGLGAFRTQRPGLEILRAFCLMASSAANLTAVSILPLTVTGSINFTMPLMITALSVPFLGERVGWRRWTAIGVGLAGILVIVRPGSDIFQPAAILPLLGAFFAGLYFLLTRTLSRYDSIATQQIYAALIATIVFAPLALSNWVWPSDPVTWVVFFGIGTVGFIGHQLSTTAHGLAPASVLAPFGYTQIVWLTAVSWVVFDDPPDVWIYLGAPIIIGSGLYIWLRERQLHKAVATEALPPR